MSNQNPLKSQQDQSMAAADVLPRPEKPFAGVIGRTLAESTPAPLDLVQAPHGAPNILVVLLDDVGFGQMGTFGGLTPTPALDRLASEGLVYNRFHSTAMCTPTRAAMLTGRNPHLIGNGAVTDFATGFPGYNSMWPKSAASVAEILRQNGYATSCIGKWHNTPVWETGPTGPFDRWPTGLGFEYFYGFLGGGTSQWEPTLYEQTVPVVNTAPRKDYHLTTEMTDRAIRWINTSKSLAPDKPFFLWYAPGATHAPHHVAQDWIARFKGRFDSGWDAYREQVFERQKELGVIPVDTVLTPRPAEIPAWSDVGADEKRLYARMMEVFAAFTAQTDYEIGRLVDWLRQTGQYDNTLILYCVGDNGASGEGGLQGTVDAMSQFNNVDEGIQQMLERIDELGGPKHYNHFPTGWGWAMDTPFQWLKRIASHLGGVRNPLVVTWPERIKNPGQRRQFHHSMDVMPTILEAAGLTMPKSVNGAEQAPINGISMFYSFDDENAQDRRRTQVFEILSNRAIYHEGWWAGARETLPWKPNQFDFHPDDSKWELYYLPDDFSQSRDLAAEHPEKLRELQELFWSEARKYNILPLDGRGNRMADAQALTAAHKPSNYTFYPGTVGIFEAVAPDVKNRSFEITASVVIPESGAEGVLVAMGGRIGGYSLFVRDRRLHYWYNFLGIEQICVTSAGVLEQGKHQLGVRFDYDGGGTGKGGLLRLIVDGVPVAERRLERTVPTIFSRDTFDIGMDLNAPVADYESPFAFTGNLEKVDLMLGPKEVAGAKK